jgi:phage terminase large subunit-like protein
MGEYGWTKEKEDLILINQCAEVLSNAMKLCEADFRHQLINYNENEVDKWCLKNASIKLNDKGQCLCVKSEKNKRIDGAVTLISLYEMYRRYRTDFKTIINNQS